MTKKIIFLTVLVGALPLTAFANGGVASSDVKLITTLPEAHHARPSRVGSHRFRGRNSAQTEGGLAKLVRKFV